MRTNFRKALALLILLASTLTSLAQGNALADSIALHQMANGGWPKNQNWLKGAEPEVMKKCTETGIGSTIDNGATTTEIRILAKADGGTGTYHSNIERGMRYLLEMQYANGGFPQFYPARKGVPYASRITFNDNAMTSVLRLFRDILTHSVPFDRVQFSPSLNKAIRESYSKSIKCILDCQIRDSKGTLTVWCQQHDQTTLLPAPARAYELASYCAYGETCDLLHLLMDELEHPLSFKRHASKARIRKSIDSAVQWLECHALDASAASRCGITIPDSTPLIWTRYYDLEAAEPLFSDRDGLPRKRLDEVGEERRNGYSWYGDSPRKAIARWKKMR